jgi:hypothetical protein
MLLCLFWVLLTIRGFEQHRYWILAARELEEQYLAPTVKTISVGGQLAAGKSVEMNITGVKPLHLSRLSRRISAAWTSYLVIGVFFVLYALFLIFG